MDLSPIVIIPARNEAQTIYNVVTDLRTCWPHPVLVVDDNSTDETASLAEEGGALVISLLMPLGAWGATQTGLRFAKKKGHNAVITMDADGQHLAEYVPRLTAALCDEDCDVVIGACPQRASRARHVAWGMFRRLSGFDLADLTSGFRIYNHRAINVLAGAEATLLDYQDIGALILLRKAGLIIREVPVKMRPRQNGASRIFNSWWTVARYMSQTAILCLARWNHGR